MLSNVVERCQRIMAVVARNALATLLLVSVGLNVSLSHELRVSRRGSANGPLPGSILPPIHGIEARAESIVPSKQEELPTVFYYFSAACGWCDRNWANIEVLAKQTSGRYRIVGVAASDEVPDVLRERGIPMSVLTDVDSGILAAYGFRGTPQTVVIGNDGRVLQAWTGAFEGDQAKRVERFFGVHLPGLLPRKTQPRP